MRPMSPPKGKGNNSNGLNVYYRQGSRQTGRLYSSGGPCFAPLGQLHGAYAAPTPGQLASGLTGSRLKSKPGAAGSKNGMGGRFNKTISSIPFPGGSTKSGMGFCSSTARSSVAPLQARRQGSIGPDPLWQTTAADVSGGIGGPDAAGSDGSVLPTMVFGTPLISKPACLLDSGRQGGTGSAGARASATPEQAPGLLDVSAAVTVRQSVPGVDDVAGCRLQVSMTRQQRQRRQLHPTHHHTSPHTSNTHIL